MLTEGALLVERAAGRIPQPPVRAAGRGRTALRALAATMRDRGLTPWDRLAAAEDPGSRHLAHLAAARSCHQSRRWS